MKILLVNNTSIHFPALKELLEKDHVVTSVHIEELKSEMATSHDVVVLSGGSKYEVSDSPEMFEEQFKIFKSGKPVFGVCLGFQAICHAFGEKVEKLGFEVEGIIEVQKTKNDPLLKGLKKSFKAYEGHSWGVKKINGELITLAQSKHCVEMVKHPKLPVYGTQFHPEVHQELDGLKVLENFLKKYSA
ncbi:gamma-glutamyl-gamma-aminobutyrate hydrolase family protein [Candidatus Woesearchaeota archaeon]|nr:gamma-glutamyl-gamma-aminobutyrate hydrolase family protein [Candidatus Woesearchaeota archaeon]